MTTRLEAGRVKQGGEWTSVGSASARAAHVNTKDPSQVSAWSYQDPNIKINNVIYSKLVVDIGEERTYHQQPQFISMRRLGYVDS